MANHWLKQAQARRNSIVPQPGPEPAVPPMAADNSNTIEAGDSTARAERGLLHLGELVPVVRKALDIDPTLPDEDIADSLKQITARADMRARWLSAFNSPLGRWLVVRGSDLNTSLNAVLALLPPARS